MSYQVDRACNSEERGWLLVREVVEGTVVEHNRVEERATGVLEVVSCKEGNMENNQGEHQCRHTISACDVGRDSTGVAASQDVALHRGSAYGGLEAGHHDSITSD